MYGCVRECVHACVLVCKCGVTRNYIILAYHTYLACFKNASPPMTCTESHNLDHQRDSGSGRDKSKPPCTWPPVTGYITIWDRVCL